MPLSLLAALALPIPAAAPEARPAAQARESVACRVTVDTSAPRYRVLCPAMPISRADAPNRAERGSEAPTASSRAP